MAGTTQLFTDVDFERDGKQVDWLHLPHSVTRSAYGTIAIPLACIRNGRGPTVFLMAGNHGDEYEGLVVLNRFVREIDAGRVQGRIIVMPAANLPAVMAGHRVSPIDGGNLNRAFPGDPNGGPTAQIAHYIDSVIYPITDYMQDFHSGGASLDYLPFISMRRSGDAELDRRAFAALSAFGMPLAQIWGVTPDTRLSSPAALRHGIVCLGSEFGGGGSVSIEGVRRVWRGLNNLLAHAGVLPPEAAEPQPAPRVVEVRGRDDYVYAPERGVFEPFHELGAEVEAGEPCGQVLFPDDPMRAPVVANFRRGGLLVCKRHPGLVERGDCVAHLAGDYAGDLG
jgi:predicted deacylase